MVCVVILAMWAVSTRVLVMYYSRHTAIGWLHGEVSITRTNRLAQIWSQHWKTEQTGFDAGTALPRVSGRSRGYISLTLPFWLLFTLAAIPTAILWRRDRRTVNPGHCLTCGYDLRASKKTCPECGAAIGPGVREN